MTNPISHPKYGQFVYAKGGCPLCGGSIRKSWPDETFLKKCLNCGQEYGKRNMETCNSCKTNLFPVGEPRPEGVVMNQKIPIIDSTYTCEKCNDEYWEASNEADATLVAHVNRRL